MVRGMAGMVSVVGSRTLENLSHFRAQHCFHSIRLPLSARHSAYVGRVHSQFLCDSSVESAEKRDERRRPIRRFVTIHESPSGVIPDLQRSRRPDTDVMPPAVVFCPVRHTLDGHARNPQSIENNSHDRVCHLHYARDGVCVCYSRGVLRGFPVPEHNSNTVREPIEPIASKWSCYQTSEMLWRFDNLAARLLQKSVTVRAEILLLIEVAMTKTADPVVGGNRFRPASTETECVADILERELDTTIQNWLGLVEKELDLSRIPLKFEERTGHLPKLLHDVIARLRLDKGTRAPLSVAASHHGKLRRKQGYTVAMVVDESRILQVCIFSTLHRNTNSVDFEKLLPDVVIIADEVDAQLKQQVLCFLPGNDVEKSEATR
jgi:hypothetical protein